MIRSFRRLFLPTLLIALALHQIVFPLRVLQLPDDLRAQLSLNPTFDLVIGFGWALAFSAAALLLIRRSPTVRSTALAMLALFTVTSFGRLWVFTRAEYDQGRLPFLAWVTAGIMFGIISVLLIGLRHTRRAAAPVAEREELHGHRASSDDRQN